MKKLTAAEHNVGLRPFWAGQLLLPEFLQHHFCVVGCTGSGKSVTLQLLMQALLPSVGKGDVQHCALVYDSKRDLVPVLAAVAPDAERVIMNPFDARSTAWDLAADIDSPAVAMQVAEVFIPAESHASQPFFTDAARHLMTGAMLGLREKLGTEWGLRDLLLVCRDPELLENLLLSSPESEYLKAYFREQRENASVMSTLLTKLARFEAVAAASAACEKKLSLQSWVKSRKSILVLGNDETVRSSCDALNQAIFKRVSELLLTEPEHPQRRCFMFLDEVREAGTLNGLPQLLTRGRSKGVTVALGFQDIEGLRAVYGAHQANELVSQCAVKAVFRVTSPETAKWAEGLAGTKLREEPSYSSGDQFQRGPFGIKQPDGHMQVGESLSFQERKVFYDSEFLENPYPDSTKGSLTGFYFLPGWAKKVSFNPFEKLLRPEPLVSSFEPRSYSRLKGFTSAELDKLASPSARIPDDARGGYS